MAVRVSLRIPSSFFFCNPGNYLTFTECFTRVHRITPRGLGLLLKKRERAKSEAVRPYLLGPRMGLKFERRGVCVYLVHLSYLGSQVKNEKMKE